MMYLLLSGLRRNHEGESRIHVCTFVKPLVSQGCLSQFPTDYRGRNRRFHLGIWDDSFSALLSVQKEIIY